MEQWIITSLTLGLIQGLTEIFPISSTAHLIIVGKLLNFVGPKASFFEVAVQLGSIMAVVVIFWRDFWELLFPVATKKFTGIWGIWILFLTTLPTGIIGFLFYSQIKKLFTPQAIVVTLIAGSIFILLGEAVQKRISNKIKSLNDIKAKTAFYIGCFQCLSLWPGFSRSAATIVGGLFLGLTRAVAVKYSFMAAVPVMVAATGYDIIKNWSLIGIQDLPFFSVAMISAFISALLAIKIFFKLMTTITLRLFAYYRLILAALIYFFF